MNKKNLSMNTRDKNLLILLALIVIVYIAYMYVISPAMVNGDALKANLQSVNSEITVAQDNITNLPTLRQDEAKLKTQLVQKYKGFFYDLPQERILYQLDTLIGASAIKVTAYGPTPIALGQILMEKGSYSPLQYPLLDLARKTNPTYLITEISSAIGQATTANPNVATDPNAAVDPNAVTTDTGGANVIPFTDVTLSIAATNYANVINFINSLEKMQKTIIVKSINLSKADAAGVQGQILISFYAMPKLDDSDKDYLKFLPVTSIGKTNPFN